MAHAPLMTPTIPFSWPPRRHIRARQVLARERRAARRRDRRRVRALDRGDGDDTRVAIVVIVKEGPRRSAPPPPHESVVTPSSRAAGNEALHYIASHYSTVHYSTSHSVTVANPVPLTAWWGPSRRSAVCHAFRVPTEPAVSVHRAIMYWQSQLEGYLSIGCVVSHQRAAAAAAAAAAERPSRAASAPSVPHRRPRVERDGKHCVCVVAREVGSMMGRDGVPSTHTCCSDEKGTVERRSVARGEPSLCGRAGVAHHDEMMSVPLLSPRDV